MKSTPLSRTLALLAATGALSLAGCSILETDRIDYKSAGKGVSLEVPPDLTQLGAQSRYQVPGSTVTASGYQTTLQQPSAGGGNTAANQVGDVRFNRTADGRWITVDRTPDKLWGPVRDFWQENGFLLALDQANLGIMETDWAENRAKIPQDVIRRTLGKVFDGLYSTGERDKFRTRMERNAAGGTDIFVTHRGMQEVFTNSQKDSTAWQPRASDPELETEFLRRMMVKLGLSQDQAQAQVTAGATPGAAGTGAPAAARVVASANGSALQLDDDFDRAWRRVGLALDRTGFTVEDRNRSQGVYYVRYVNPTLDKKEPGFFGKIFGAGTPQLPTEKYQIAVRTQGQVSTVSVLDERGGAVPPEVSQRLTRVLAAELK